MVQKKHSIYSKQRFLVEYTHRNWEWYREVLADCIRYGKPGGFLDLGAGLGYFVECARRFNIPCIGLEGSRYAVNQAKKRESSLDVRYHLLGGPLPFPDNYFSTVIMFQVIQYLPSTVTQRLLMEVWRILETGGALCIYSPLKLEANHPGSLGVVKFYKPAELEILLMRFGFGNTVRLNYPRVFQNQKLKILNHLITGFYRTFPLELLSATSNCIGYKLSQNRL